jgi:hypothetical protein
VQTGPLVCLRRLLSVSVTPSTPFDGAPVKLS